MNNFPIITITVDDVDEYVNKLRKAERFRYLDSAAFAKVYTNRDRPDVVYKIGEVAGDPYIDYVYALQKTRVRSPLFPIIHSCTIIEEDCINRDHSLYIVEMERLKSLPSAMVSSVNDYLWPFLEEVLENKRVNRFISHFMTPEIVKALKFIDAIRLESARKPGFDLHGGNWMLRDEQLVITDPLC